MSDKTGVPPKFTDSVSTTGKPQALIGSKIRIKGELYGEEDILIQGRVEGTIEVKENNLTVGADGHVSADSKAKEIFVEGEVRGDLTGEEKVVIKATSNVNGNIVAPRVSLEEGAKFKGMIDMEGSPSSARSSDDKVASVGDKSKGPKMVDQKDDLAAKTA